MFAHRSTSYRRALAQYHLNPEAKFRGADYLDTGLTERRSVRVVDAADVLHIGKEANRWEEQFFLGFDPEAQTLYGLSDTAYAALRDEVLRGCEPFGVMEIARAVGLKNHSVVSDFVHDKTRPDVETLRRIRAALPTLIAAGEDRDRADQQLLIKADGRIREDGLRPFAAAIRENHANLWATVRGRRPLSKRLREKLRPMVDPRTKDEADAGGG